MPKETMTVRIEPETREALDAIATALDRDRSHVVNEALATFVETHRWQIQQSGKACARRTLVNSQAKRM